MSVPVPSGALLVRAERFDLAPQKCLIDIYRISGSSPAFYRWYRGSQGMYGGCSDRYLTNGINEVSTPHAQVLLAGGATARPHSAWLTWQGRSGCCGAYGPRSKDCRHEQVVLAAESSSALTLISPSVQVSNVNAPKSNAHRDTFSVISQASLGGLFGERTQTFQFSSRESTAELAARLPASAAALGLQARRHARDEDGDSW